MAQRSDDNIYKLVLLGAAGVGKTSMARRCVNLDFDHKVESTVGCAFFQRTIYIRDTRLKFNIWDTAGQERYHCLTDMYFRGADATIVVYDITKEQTFQHAVEWVEEARHEVGPNIVVVLAGNKTDKANQREVDYWTGYRYATDNNLIFVETSVKKENITEVLLLTIGEKLLKASRKQEKETSNSGRSVKLGTRDKAQSKPGSCCF